MPGKICVECKKQIGDPQRCNSCGAYRHQGTCGGPVPPDIDCDICKHHQPTDDNESDATDIGVEDSAISEESSTDCDGFIVSDSSSCKTHKRRPKHTKRDKKHHLKKRLLCQICDIVKQLHRMEEKIGKM